MGYTLIKHLKNLCDNDIEYSSLYASWMTEKEVISKALSTINFNFPHFSLHDETHSISIIKNIEMLLGEDRIKLLGATETWIILMSAYLHDLGMVVLNELLDEKWQKNEFQDYLITLSESNDNKDLQEAASYILNIQKIISNSKDDKYTYINERNWPIKIRNYMIQISSDYFRRNHARRSEDYIKNSSKNNIFKINNSGIILERLIKVIGDIVLCHELTFDDCLKDLKYKSNGIGTDKFHPRFIACLIRLGDLLDLDNGRFNIYFEKTIGKIPKISEYHRAKHSSITHLLIEPKTIEIEANCENEDVYRITREWINWIVDEIKNLSSNWSKIVPENFIGGPPTLGNVRLYLNGQANVNEQVDLKFTISQEKAFELFEGINIYDNKLVFIREFIQNSIDSSKIQMWRDIQKGYYDALFQLNNIDINNIQYITDIPKEVWESYQIEIEVSTDKQDEEYLVFSVIDKGCGFSKTNLSRLVNIGQSWASDEEHIVTINSMPLWLKPTGTFGMGMQSAFTVTEEISIYTKTDNERDKMISLVSGKNSGFVAVKDINESMKRRTKISVKIKKDLCSNIIHDQKMHSYDFFTFSNSDHQVLFSILDIIKKIIVKNYFPIKINIPEILDESIVLNCNYHNKKLIKNYNEWLQYQVELDDCGKVTCHLWENKLGSYVKIVPSLEILNNSDMGPYRGIKVSFRGISLKMNSAYNSYFSINWDLLGIETREYLDISRIKINTNKEIKLVGFLNKTIIPIALHIIHKQIELWLLNNASKKEMKYEKDLFTLYLGYLIYCNKSEAESFYLVIKDYLNTEISGKVCKLKNDQPIKLSQFFSLDSFLVYEQELFSVNEELEIQEKYCNEDYEAYLTKPTFFNEYLKKFFDIEKIYTQECSNETINLFKMDGLQDLNSIFIMRRKDNLLYRTIEVNELDRKKIILTLKDDDFNYTRKLIYPIKPYADYLAVNKVPEGLYLNKLDYSDCFIISPFYKLNGKYSDEEIENFIDKNKKIEDWFDNKIEIEIRKLLLNDKLIDWIIENSINSKGNLSKDKIIDSYLDIIKEFYYTKFIEIN